MRILTHAYDRLVMALAVIAGAMLAGVFLMIVYDVSVRALGYQPPAHTVPLSEYAMLYMTLLASPWLVRLKGQVFVEFIAGNLPRPIRRPLHKAVYVLCILVCIGLAWYGGAAAEDYWMRGELEIKGIITPKWVLYAPFPLGFGLCVIEFGRFLFGFDNMYDRRPSAEIEGI